MKEVADDKGSRVTLLAGQSNEVAWQNDDRKYIVISNPDAGAIRDVPNYAPGRVHVRLHQAGAAAAAVAFWLDPGERWDAWDVGVGLSAYHDENHTLYLVKGEI